METEDESQLPRTTKKGRTKSANKKKESKDEEAPAKKKQEERKDKVPLVILRRLQYWSAVKSHTQQLKIHNEGKMRGTVVIIYLKALDIYDLLVDELIKQQTEFHKKYSW